MFSRAVISKLANQTVLKLVSGRILPPGNLSNVNACGGSGLRWAYMPICRGYAIKVGDTASLSKTFTQQDIQSFSEISLDTNPVHLDPEFAAGTRFRKPICHGLMVVSLLSGLMGTIFPGTGTILVGMDIQYQAPVYPGQEITVFCELSERQGRKGHFTYKLFTSEQDGSEKIVISGSVDVLLPKDK